MSYFRIPFSVVLAVAIAAPTASMAGAIGGSLATVADVTGVVLVATDDQFSTATVGSKLTTGSRVLTMENGSAVLAYADGCRLQIGENTMVAVRSGDECALKTVDSRVVGSQYAALGDAKAPSPSPSPSGGIISSTIALAGGGIVAGGLVAAGSFGNNNNNDGPVSGGTF